MMEMIKSLGCSVHLLLWSKHQNKKGLITQERRADPVTVRGRQSPEKLPKVFYSSKQWVCRGGVRLPCVSVPSWRHFPRAWDPLVYFAGTWWGYFLTAPTWKQTRTRLGVCFFFLFSSLHQTPSASQPPHIWYGAVGNGLSGARYVCVTLLFQCKKCTVLQAAAGIGATWEFCDVHGEDCSFRTGLPLLGLHDCFAHLCHNRGFLQPCRTIVNAPRHECTALPIPSPKKALEVTYFPLIADMRNILIGC